MATLALTLAGGLLGNSIFGATAFTLFGTAVSGGALGAAIGGLAGSVIDAKLFMPRQEGPRLTDLNVMSSAEGSPMARVAGTMRVSTQLIWATRFRETKTTEEVGGSAAPGTTEVTTYSYSCSFAVALCEGTIAGIGTVWADGKAIKLSDYDHRLYKGTETQARDPLIAAVEGEDNAPAYRGTAYLLFEELPLVKFGNRLPQITVEVIADTGGTIAVGDLIARICAESGLTVETDAIAGVCGGYVTSGQMTARAELEPLGMAYLFDLRQSRDRIVCFPRGGQAPVATLSRGDLVAGDPDFSRTQRQQSELPRSLSLRYADGTTDYQSRIARSTRQTGAPGQDMTIEIPAKLGAPRAQAIADALLTEVHVARDSLTGALPPSLLAIEPGDVIRLTDGGPATHFRLSSVGFPGERPFEAARYESSVYSLIDGPAVDRPVFRARDPVAPEAIAFLDLPILTSGASAHAPYVAATGRPWSRVAVYRSDDAGEDGARDTIIDSPSIMGVTQSDLPAGPLWQWDRGTALTVSVPTGRVLASRTELSVLNQANAMAVETPAGRWEILQWRDADLVGPNLYRISHLLRGSLGTDADMPALNPAGARYAVLDPASLVQTSLPMSLRAARQTWRWGPAALPPSNALYQHADFAFRSIGLRPYAPTRATATKLANGDIALGWIRRTRIDGDDWDAEEVPLGEETEKYRISIVDGSTMVRTVTVSIATGEIAGWTYPYAAQVEDFGAPLTSEIRIHVAQVSAIFGAGARLVETMGL